MTVNATQNNPATPPAPAGMRQPYQPDFRVELKNLPPWVRPEVVYWYPTWLLIRDAIAGERQLKALGSAYLPALSGMTGGEYNTFKDRATYYNFSARTVSAMSGAIFRRVPLIEGLDDFMLKRLKTAAKENNDFETFTSGTSEEVIKLGRYGVLLDLPATVTTDPRPYMAGYTAENILDWDEGEDKNGMTIAVRWVLRENNSGREAATGARKAYVRFRELVLEFDHGLNRQVYRQYIYERKNEDAELKESDRGPAITPLRRGEPLDFIPFQIFGPHLSGLAVEKPPMEDIAQLNISHYRSYAYLEHGRFFAGFPIYTSEEPQGGGDVDYEIGSSRVWVVPAGGKARILEMNGQGLKFLENACAQKQDQATSLGGKMMGSNPETSKGADQLALEERNEQSVLLKTTRQLDKGFTQLVKWWSWWQGMSQEEVDKIEITFNKDFLFGTAGAREFRAVHQMYKDGLIPVDVLYYYLKKGNVIPDWMKQDEFEKLLQKMTSFPGQPDAEARAEGFKDRAQQLADEQKNRGFDIQQEEIDLQAAGQEDARKAAAAAAKAPKSPVPAPVVGPPGVTLPSVKPTGK